jgi:hypothetical protein
MAAAPSDPTSVAGCGHAFCYVCIHQWGATRRAPTCPVCRGPMAALVLADGREQPVAAAPAAAGASDEGPDLSCLDHAYFLAEVSRLVSRADGLRGRLYRDTMNCGRRGSAEGERALAGLSEVLARLESYRRALGGEHAAPFEAEPLLHGAFGRARGGGAGFLSLCDCLALTPPDSKRHANQQTNKRPDPLSKHPQTSTSSTAW